MTEETQNPTKLIAIYARVSTSNQENEGTIETQLLALREFTQKNGYTIAQEYLDNGWSGDILARPSLDQLRMDAKKKIWEAVLIYDPDRLARRAAWQEVVTEELKELEVEVLYVTIPKAKTDEEIFMYKMRGVFSEYERMKIKERFRLGKLRKAKEGHILTTEPLYGYNYIRKTTGPNGEKVHGYYEINPEEARIVKMIFSWIADEGLKIRAVVRRLQELVIKPRKSKRGLWNTSTITNMLKNKTYIGEGHWGASYAVVPGKPIKNEKYKKIKKTSRRMKPEEEWIASKIPVPPIIEKELFDRVRAQLKTNSNFCPRNKKYKYLLGGKMLCACGKTRGGVGPQHGKHLYYRCNDRIYSFPLPPTCLEGAINARIADDIVWNEISKLMSSPDLITAQANRWLDAKKTKINGSAGDLSLMEKEIKKLKEQEDRYNKAYGAGLFSIEKLKEYTSPIRDRLASLETQIAKVKQEENGFNSPITPTPAEIKDFAEESAETLHSLSFEAKRAIMMGVLDKIIGTQQKLEVYGYLPIVPNHHVIFKTISRNRWTAECGQKHSF